MSSEPTLFVVDDDAAVTDAIERLAHVVGIRVECFANAPAFLEQFDPERPGCLVLDVSMPGMSGLELQQRLRAENSSLPIILITGHADIPMCVQAMRQGAFHFLEKPFRPAELVTLVRSAFECDARHRQSAESQERIACKLAALTPDERQILNMVLEGQVNKEVALELDVSVRTVQLRLSRIMRKMGVSTRPALIRLMLPIFRKALDQELLDPVS